MPTLDSDEVVDLAADSELDMMMVGFENVSSSPSTAMARTTSH